MRIDRLGFVALSAWLTACTDMPTQPELVTPPIPYASWQAALEGQVARSSAPLTLDERFAAAARLVPGFAGVWFDRGELIVMADPDGPIEQTRAVTEALLTWSGRGQTAATLMATMKIRAAQFNFEDLLRWKFIANRSAGSLGIHMIDIDERGNKLRLATALGDPSTVRAGLVAQGVPAEAIEVVVGEYSTPDNLLENYYRPVFAGLKIGFDWTAGSCTIGSIVKHVDEYGNSGAARYLVTASHCTETFGAVDDDTVGQPTVSNPIGVEIHDFPTFTNQEDPQCPVGSNATMNCRYSDAALFQLNAADLGYLWHFSPNIGTDLWGRPVMEIDWFDQDDEAFIGDDVRMAGQASGHEDGVVTATCVNHAQFSASLTPLNRTILCTSDADYSRASGDSGAPVFRFDMPMGVWTLVGIHYSGNGSGGGTFANMTFVASETLPQGWGGGLCFSEFSMFCFQ